MSQRDPWFKFYPSDWLRDTRHLSLEQRGAYIDSIAIQMERGKPLPDDCSWLAHQMHISSRKARVIVAELLALKVLTQTGNELSNARCERELAAREAQRVANTETAVNRERTKRESAPNQSRTSDEPELNQNPISDEKSKKPNTINVAAANLWHENSTILESDIDTDKETETDKNITPLPPKGGVDRKTINREAAKIAFGEWQTLAKACDLTVPRDTTFQTFGKKMAARMYEHAEEPKGVAEMIAVWRQAMANVERSSFLRGMKPEVFGGAHLKFLCQRESFAKVIDGGYGNGAHAISGARSGESYVDRMARLMGVGDPPPATEIEILPSESVQ